MSSVSVENFLKTVYRLETQAKKGAKPGAVAKELGISNAASTDMAKKLSLKKMVDYEKYKGLKLTPVGKKLALSVMRKHRLWETFLHKVFALDMHEIHREAELLEHQTSDFMANLLDNYLGNPTEDPHGDPIPKNNGFIIQDINSIPLHSGTVNQPYEVKRLMGKEKEFFQICKLNHIAKGSEITIINKFPHNQLLECRINDSNILLPEDFAQKIIVCYK